MQFRRLRIREWQQFSDIDLAFHPRLTVLTGANGSGKTTILRFLARHFGWDHLALRTPVPDRVRGFRYLIQRLLSRDPRSSTGFEIGTIEYDSGEPRIIRVPQGETEAPYNPTIDNAGSVPGLFIPSHRVEFRYQRVDQLSLHQRLWKREAFTAGRENLRSFAQGRGGRSPSYHMKEAIIGLAIYGYGNPAVPADPLARSLFESFQATLTRLLPDDIGFQSLAVRDRSEVVLVTRTGDFLLDAVSGGLAALIELAWQIFMFDPEDSSLQDASFTVVIDEPENHLHAAMQRRLLPSFVEAFPLAQFIVATHSPLIVGSVQDSYVYALRFSKEHKVDSERLDLRDKSGSAEQVLREVLDVDVSIPIWAESALRGFIERYLSEPLTIESARQLRSDMTQAGLARLVPDALVRIAMGELPRDTNRRD